MLRLSVVEHLSKIARVERLAADWAVDKVLRFVLYRPVMRPALIACGDVVGSNPGHRQVPLVVLAADISRLSRSTVTSGPRSTVDVLVDARDLAFQVNLLASVHLGVVDDGMWELVTWDRDAYAVLCYPPSNRGSNRHLVTNAYSPSHAMDSGAGSVFFKRLLIYASHPKAEAMSDWMCRSERPAFASTMMLEGLSSKGR
ncbi:hypothetical protein [Mesorhizobium sp. M1112]|uniref:hypothetical protein n=1 Tax=unclassified Mesorhizobium TaxID=325217 RepID=UPI00333A105B